MNHYHLHIVITITITIIIIIIIIIITIIIIVIILNNNNNNNKNFINKFLKQTKLQYICLLLFIQILLVKKFKSSKYNIFRISNTAIYSIFTNYEP